ncbi:hypothetical protein Pmani_032467 [Petrolisthes manimaculis]|uniref:Protein Abitram n=1 Tax=Petrolisthes manimaculis TaxID=1843537 RepID=A0AAE1NTA3_9EUCA|nr:hypothetical protein Pmani_032467 [Petrolisthes manimaculis]
MTNSYPSVTERYFTKYYYIPKERKRKNALRAGGDHERCGEGVVGDGRGGEVIGVGEGDDVKCGEVVGDHERCGGEVGLGEGQNVRCGEVVGVGKGDDVRCGEVVGDHERCGGEVGVGEGQNERCGEVVGVGEGDDVRCGEVVRDDVRCGEVGVGEGQNERCGGVPGVGGKVVGDSKGQNIKSFNNDHKVKKTNDADKNNKKSSNDNIIDKTFEEEEEEEMICDTRDCSVAKRGSALDSSGHVCVMVHTNKLCLVTLSHKHPIIAQHKQITQVSYEVGKFNRLDNRVSGKGKRGAQMIGPESPLCIITCSDDTHYSIMAGVHGKLVEVNERLLTNPSLVTEKPDAEGYIAVVLPPLRNTENVTTRLLNQQQYACY